MKNLFVLSLFVATISYNADATVTFFEDRLEIAKCILETEKGSDEMDCINRYVLLIAGASSTDIFIAFGDDENPNIINFKDVNGNTALHRAVIVRDVNRVKKLLENNADTNSQNKDGKTPLMLARQLEYSEIAELFEKQEDRK